MVKKISIIGAGNVGSVLAFSILQKLDIKELVLVDISGKLAQGIALDLEDTRKFLNFSTQIKGTKNISAIKNSDLVVVTAGVTRKEGMTRLDLFKINSKIAKDLSAKIKKFAPFSIVIVVTNPLDFITYVVVKETNFSRFRVIGMGSGLDTARLINLLYKTTKICCTSLEGIVFGLHTKDMIVSLKRAKVNGESIEKFASLEKLKKVEEQVPLRGAKIVSCLKNKSAYFSPSLAVYQLVEAIVKDKNEIIPVSVLLEGEYGLKDVCLGVPCVINHKGIEKIIEMELDEREKKKMKIAQETFRECMI
ncbi:MAG TPA: malate dehydrogenase [Candidatus Omnitrophica bacterium]|nr:malate dehydrogenase [Candidatus Omnitrophota bacterium]